SRSRRPTGRSGWISGSCRPHSTAVRWRHGRVVRARGGFAGSPGGGARCGVQSRRAARPGLRRRGVGDRGGYLRPLLSAQARARRNQYRARPRLPAGQYMSGRPIGDEVLVRRAARDVAVQIAALVAVAMLLLVALVTVVVVRGQAG